MSAPSVWRRSRSPVASSRSRWMCRAFPWRCSRARAMNVCMVGYGMMGVWHSEALKKTDAVLHTVVGRRPEAAKEFAERYGYKKWTASLDEALGDPEVDIVIVG